MDGDFVEGLELEREGDRQVVAQDEAAAEVSMSHYEPLVLQSKIASTDKPYQKFASKVYVNSPPPVAPGWNATGSEFDATFWNDPVSVFISISIVTSEKEEIREIEKGDCSHPRMKNCARGRRVLLNYSSKFVIFEN